jgi:hypothetical protein
MGNSLCQKKNKEDRTYFKPVLINSKKEMTQNQINEEIFILEFQNEKGVTFMQHQAKFCTGDSVIHIKNRISRDYNINLLYYTIITIKKNNTSE